MWGEYCWEEYREKIKYKCYLTRNSQDWIVNGQSSETYRNYRSKVPGNSALSMWLEIGKLIDLL